MASIRQNIKKILQSLPFIRSKHDKYIQYIRSCYNYDNPVPTIICSTCIGGMISHNLGLRFMSPTINLWIVSKDFVKFVCNLREYISYELLEVYEENFDYPIGQLKDVKIYFNHYPDFQTAKQKWDERKQRINYNNIFCITDDLYLTDEELFNLESLQFKRTIIFTALNRPNNSCCYQMKAYEKDGIIGRYSVRDFKGFSEFERVFNYSKWLNGEDDFSLIVKR